MIRIINEIRMKTKFQQQSLAELTQTSAGSQDDIGEDIGLQLAELLFQILSVVEVLTSNKQKR